MGFYGFARAVVCGFYRLAFRIQVEGTENVPPTGAFVVCANHQSYLDPPLLGVCLSSRRLRYMAKEELFRNPFFGKLIESLGAFPIKRGRSDVGALRASMTMLRQGEPVVVFPEGGRSKDGRLKRGKPGAALIAAKAGVPILPVGIEGPYRFLHRLTVRIGPPIYPALPEKLETADLQRLTEAEIMPAIAGLAGAETYANRDS